MLNKHGGSSPPLGTIAPLRLVRDLPEHFLIMNGDILTDLDFAALYAAHVASGALGTVATYERDATIDFGVIRFDAARRVTGFTEKPTAHYSVSMGVNVFSRGVLDLIPPDTHFGFDDLVLAMIARGCDLRAYPFNGYWLDIGRPEDYDRANAEFEALRDRFLPPGRP